MKVVKNITNDGIIATSTEIKLLYDDGNSYKISSVRFKATNKTTYTLYVANNRDSVISSYKYVVNLLEEKYNMKIYPIYYEDGDRSIAIFKLGTIEFSLSCEHNENIILLSSNQQDVQNVFSDDLAVFITYNLFEKNSKKHSIGG